MTELFTVSALLSLLTLTVMEIVLGIDNIIFVSIVSSKLPKELQNRGRTIGLSLALIVRICLLFGISWLKEQTHPLFSVFGYGFSIRDLILIAGGIFLMIKSVMEVHEKLEGEDVEKEVKKMSFQSAIIQIVALDVVFSFDSILTAIGIADHVEIMIAAVIISMGIMMLFSVKVADFIDQHPSLKMLALSFLIMIGFMLISEGLPKSLGIEIQKESIYFAMAFAFSVELLNMRFRKKSNPVKLKNSQKEKLEDDIYAEEK